MLRMNYLFNWCRHPVKGILTLCCRRGSGDLERSGNLPAVTQAARGMTRIRARIQIGNTCLRRASSQPLSYTARPFRKRSSTKHPTNAVCVDSTSAGRPVQEWLLGELAEPREQGHCATFMAIITRRKQMRMTVRVQNLPLTKDFQGRHRALCFRQTPINITSWFLQILVSREFGVLLWELSEVQIIYYKVQAGPHPFTLSVGLWGDRFRE